MKNYQELIAALEDKGRPLCERWRELQQQVIHLREYWNEAYVARQTAEARNAMLVQLRLTWRGTERLPDPVDLAPLIAEERRRWDPMQAAQLDEQEAWDAYAVILGQIEVLKKEQETWNSIADDMIGTSRGTGLDIASHIEQTAAAMNRTIAAQTHA